VSMGEKRKREKEGVVLRGGERNDKIKPVIALATGTVRSRDN